MVRLTMDIWHRMSVWSRLNEIEKLWVQGEHIVWISGVFRMNTWYR